MPASALVIGHHTEDLDGHPLDVCKADSQVHRRSSPSPGCDGRYGPEGLLRRVGTFHSSHRAAKWSAGRDK